MTKPAEPSIKNNLPYTFETMATLTALAVLVLLVILGLVMEFCGKRETLHVGKGTCDRQTQHYTYLSNTLNSYLITMFWGCFSSVLFCPSCAINAESILLLGINQLNQSHYQPTMKDEHCALVMCCHMLFISRLVHYPGWVHKPRTLLKVWPKITRRACFLYQ